MNVSLPKLAAHAMPAKTFLPGTSATSGNFSTLLAEAQDPPDSSVADILNRRNGNAQKKMFAKGDKNDQADPKPLSAQRDSTLPKGAAINPIALESKPALTSLVLTVAPKASQQEERINDSDAALAAKEFASDSVVAIPARLTAAANSTLAAPVAGTKPNVSVYPVASGAVISGQSGANQPDAPDPAQDSQQTGLTSTSMSSNWTAGDEATSFRSGVLPSAVNLEPTATPNGKPANAQPKAASAETTRGTTSTLDTKVQAAFTFLQSHPASSVTPLSHVMPDAPRGQQEKSVAPGASEAAKSETHKKEFDGAGSGASQLSKAEPPSSGAAPGNSAAAQGVTAAAVSAPGSAVSMQMSTPTVDGHAGAAAALPKASSALPHSQSMVGSQDADGTPEAASISVSSPLHTAKLIAGMEQSELRVGLRSGEFGNIDIRTSLVRNQFTAEISVERGELGRALAAELPSLQHRLTEHHLPSVNITVQDHSSGGSSDFRQRSRPGQGIPAPASVSDQRAHQESIPAAPLETMEASARLDIHM